MYEYVLPPVIPADHDYMGYAPIPIHAHTLLAQHLADLFSKRYQRNRLQAAELDVLADVYDDPNSVPMPFNMVVASAHKEIRLVQEAWQNLPMCQLMTLAEREQYFESHPAQRDLLWNMMWFVSRYMRQMCINTDSLSYLTELKRLEDRGDSLFVDYAHRWTEQVTVEGDLDFTSSFYDLAPERWGREMLVRTSEVDSSAAPYSQGQPQSLQETRFPDYLCPSSTRPKGTHTFSL